MFLHSERLESVNYGPVEKLLGWSGTVTNTPTDHSANGNTLKDRTGVRGTLLYRLSTVPQVHSNKVFTSPTTQSHQHLIKRYSLFLKYVLQFSPLVSGIWPSATIDMYKTGKANQVLYMYRTTGRQNHLP